MKNIVNVTFTKIKHHRTRHSVQPFWLIDSKLGAPTTKNYWILLLYAIVIFHRRWWTERRRPRVRSVCVAHIMMESPVRANAMKWPIEMSKYTIRCEWHIWCQQTHTLTHKVYALSARFGHWWPQETREKYQREKKRTTKWNIENKKWLLRRAQMRTSPRMSKWFC